MRFWFPVSELRPELIVSTLTEPNEQRHKTERTVCIRAHKHTHIIKFIQRSLDEDAQFRGLRSAI
jgi:hypothetical protein